MLRILYGIALFFITVFLLEYLSGDEVEGQEDAVRSGALPIVFFEKEDRSFNLLYGKTGESSVFRGRDVLTPIAPDRTLYVAVDPGSETVTAAGYEVRSADESRLIENGSIADLGKGDDGRLHFTVTLKDLITREEEFTFVLLLDTRQTARIRYYTRCILTDSTLYLDALDFAAQFHAVTADEKKDTAWLRTYLETTDDAENMDLTLTDIHASPQEAVFGDLAVHDTVMPVYCLDSLSGDSVVLHGEGILTLQDPEEEETLRTCTCTEYYHVRKGTERFHLIEYRRLLEEQTDMRLAGEQKGEMLLGIVPASRTGVRYSPQRTTAAFTRGGNLYLYYGPDNELVTVCGLAGPTEDVRQTGTRQDILILNLDDAGNMTFLVYGDMTEGAHRGRTGVCVYAYTHSGRVLEEKSFLEAGQPQEILRGQIRSTAYIRSSGELCLILDDNLIQLNLETGQAQVLMPEMEHAQIWSSQGGRYAAWESLQDGVGTGNIILTDLEDLTHKTLQAQEGEKLIPIGFHGEDFIYGAARYDDMLTDQAGTESYPMYCLRIVDYSMRVLAEYEEQDILISSAEDAEDRIILHRTQKTVDEEGGAVYIAAEDDQIMSTALKTQASDQVTRVYDKKFGENMLISIRGLNSQGLRITAASETAAKEAGSYLTLQELVQSVQGDGAATVHDRYYLFDTFGYLGTCTDPSEAVWEASEAGYEVMNREGKMIWKTPQSERCQLTGFSSSAGTGYTPAAICLDAMLRYENLYVSGQELAAADLDVAQVLQSASEELHVLKLTGCSFESILY